MMKVILLLVLLFTISAAQADEITLSVCRLDDDRYQFSFTGDIDGWWFNNFISADLVTLIAVGEGTEFVIYYDGTTESIFADPAAPFCHHKGDTWKPGAPSILIPASAPGWFRIEIQDAFGHWSRVTDAQHPDGIVLHTADGFVELIGSVGQDTDPAHYRLIEVNP
jgi:hypothetical protein